MQNIDPALIEQFLQNANNPDTAPTVNLFPQELVEIFAFGIIALTVITALFFLVYLISMIRKWRVQTAVLDMHRDVKELKDLMGGKMPQEKADKIDKDTSKIA
ncbi:MAG TPA: hypothetical protein PLN95_02370 [Candidatus Saccharibacteria bacterium]|nr:hypothetical protein [Candidatus Saccharibacteria bacterium]